MRFPWSTLRVSCLVASAAASGYFWRGALEEPSDAQHVVAPKVEQFDPQEPSPPFRRFGVGGVERDVAPDPEPEVAAPDETIREAGPSVESTPAATEEPATEGPPPEGEVARVPSPAEPRVSTRDVARTAPPAAAAAPPAASEPEAPPPPAPASLPEAKPASPEPKPTPPEPKPAPVAAPAKPKPPPVPEPKPEPKPEPTPKPEPKPPVVPPPSDPPPALAEPTPAPATPSPQEPPPAPAAPPAASARPSDDQRPGWGHGDKNHEHTGPPGQNKKK